MTDPNYTALLVIVDRSGSMASIRDDMVGGLNQLLATQAAEEGKLTVDIATFGDTLEWQCSLAHPQDVTVALEPRGSTALFDAIGQSVTRFGFTLAAMSEAERPDTVQVVVVTDGQENASREYSGAAVKELVTKQIEQWNWDFVYLGANQDAVLTGTELGFDSGSSMTYAASPDKVGHMNLSLNRYMTDVRRKTKREFTERERLDSGEDD